MSRRVMSSSDFSLYYSRCYGMYEGEVCYVESVGATSVQISFLKDTPEEVLESRRISLHEAINNINWEYPRGGYFNFLPYGAVYISRGIDRSRFKGVILPRAVHSTRSIETRRRIYRYFHQERELVSVDYALTHLLRTSQRPEGLAIHPEFALARCDKAGWVALLRGDQALGYMGENREILLNPEATVYSPLLAEIHKEAA